MGRAAVIWLTGWPASGKTTIAGHVAKILRNRGQLVEVLDGDEVRQWLTPDCGWTRDDKDKNVLRVADVADLLARNGVTVICALVSPFRDTRGKVREKLGDPFVEVFVDAEPELCDERRGRTLLRKMAEYMVGHRDVHQAPDNPDVVCDTNTETIEESTAKVLEAYCAATSRERND